MSRIDWRLLPLLNLLYITSYLDRANLGNAHQFLIRDLGLTELQYSTCTSNVAWAVFCFFGCMAMCFCANSRCFLCCAATKHTHTTGSSIFYLTYTLFEIPSNLMMARLGAKSWIARIAVSWGLVSAAQVWVNGYGSLVAMRLLLGLSEAGLFPGVLLYISWWYEKRERGKKIAVFYMAQV